MMGAVSFKMVIAINCKSKILNKNIFIIESNLGLVSPFLHLTCKIVGPMNTVTGVGEIVWNFEMFRLRSRLVDL